MIEIYKILFKKTHRMKVFIITLLLLPLIGFTQKIETEAFDKFDSVYTISTKSEQLGGGMMSAKYLTFACTYRDFQQVQFSGIDHSSISVSFYFRAGRVTSIQDAESSVKIEFENGKIKEYKHFGKYRILGTSDIGSIVARVEPEDEIFTTSIKSLRINTSSQNLDFEISDKKKEKVKECLALVKSSMDRLGLK